MANLGVIVAGAVIILIAMIGYFAPASPEGYTTPQLNDLCASGILQSEFSSIFGKMLVGENYDEMIVQECNYTRNMIIVIYTIAIWGAVVLVSGSVLKEKKKVDNLTCQYCNFVGMSEVELLKHNAENHLDKSPYKCEHCDFIGITEEILRNHYNDKHPDKNKWK